MKCSKCGAELAPGAQFCEECGAKVEAKKRFCRECGAELGADAKFCSKCGAKVMDLNSVGAEKAAGNIEPAETHVASDCCDCADSSANKAPTPIVTYSAEKEKSKTLVERIKELILTKWDEMDLFCKAVTISSILIFILAVVATCAGKALPIVISILQIAAIVAAVLMHKGIINLEQKNLWLKWLILTVAVLFAALNIMSYAWGTKASTTGQDSLTVPTGDITTYPNDGADTQQPERTETTKADTHNTLSITKGTEYAYMTDEWNVYIATAVSDNIIKIENWDKTMSSSKSVKHDYDVGIFKINDSENSFAWLDDEHTTFALTFTDKNNSKFKKGGTAIFTINISDSNNNKGSNYSKDIACFSYQNDDWHLYRAIPLTETLIKVETWYRSSSSGTFLFGYDLCLIDTTSSNTDFEWTDDEHTAFSITMRDEENEYEWKEETFVVFILENEDYTYFDVKSYLKKWEVGDGEAAVPATAFDYKYKNYQDVQKNLEDAGFTNITTKILYDIVWGWTEEGEVKSVSIDGRTDYEKGEVFNMDAPIIITYHMRVEDDPNKSVNSEPTKTESNEINLTMGADDFNGMNYQDAEKNFREMGFTKFEYGTVDTTTESSNDTICYIEITDWIFGDSDFAKGDAFDADSTVTFYVYKYSQPSPAYFSTNDLETTRKGNTGAFSYKSRGGSYDIYWIIDFDEGYVYSFTDGNGDASCARIAIGSGTLNDVVIITYHDGNSSWSYGLHFKWKNQPDHLIVQDNDGFTYDYYCTDLNSALSIKNEKTIYDY